MGLCRILLLPGPCAEVHGPSLKGIYTGIWVLMRLQVEISLSSSPLEVLIHPSCALKAPPQLASLASSGLSSPLCCWPRPSAIGHRSRSRHRPSQVTWNFVSEEPCVSLVTPSGSPGFIVRTFLTWYPACEFIGSDRKRLRTSRRCRPGKPALRMVSGSECK